MNNVVLISGVQKSDSLICIHVSIIFKFFPHLGQHRILSRVPCAIHLLQSYLSLCDPVDCSPPGSILHGILQARILEWVAMLSSRGTSRLRDRTCISYISCIGRQVLLGSPILNIAVYIYINSKFPIYWNLITLYLGLLT